MKIGISYVILTSSSVLYDVIAIFKMATKFFLTFFSELFFVFATLIVGRLKARMPIV